jgi:polysaccharide export outer membrane protein
MIRTNRIRATVTLTVAAALVLVGTTATAQSATYAVGPQDVLTISVWNAPNLSGKVTVEADGTLSLPLIGRITVGGLTLSALEAELRRKLEPRFLKNPQISVSVEEYHSRRIFVVGEVRTPGIYPLSHEMTLIEALARAGSTTDRARNEAIIVHAPAGATLAGPLLPTVTGAADVIHVALKELQSGGGGQNVVLRDADTIFVPRADNFYVFGQVRNPGAYPLQEATTVLQALSLAGGLTDRGSTRHIRIIRTVGGKKQDVAVKLDDLVRPDDTVLVPERFF